MALVHAGTRVTGPNQTSNGGAVRYRMSILLPVLILMVGLTSAQGGKTPEWKTERTTGNPKEGSENSFRIAVGEDFRITLGSNPSTGYHWELADPLNESIVQLVGTEYRAPENQSLVGAPGEELWTFRAVGQGRTMIRMKYVRPWEKGAAPAKTAVYAIEVR